MNLGTDFKKAATKVIASADKTGKRWVLHSFSGLYWGHPLESFDQELQRALTASGDAHRTGRLPSDEARLVLVSPGDTVEHVTWGWERAHGPAQTLGRPVRRRASANWGGTRVYAIERIPSESHVGFQEAESASQAARRMARRKGIPAALLRARRP